ncbi:MAG TPA: dTMP kinase [Gemmataceae bacterium]|jgi:dTMP kinase|nr:dTMP kinase [Gemmataceae bacterium]
MPPLFIVLDGIDGTGKSTQCRLLAEWLRGRGLAVTECVEPGSTAVGIELRTLLLGHRHDLALRTEALLFMAARAEVVERVIRPALAAGDVVISDRYLLANIVYQGHAGGLDVQELWRVEHFSTGGLDPDLTLILDLPIEAALARRGRNADRKELRDHEYQERLRHGFLAEARRQPEKIRVIDATPTVDEVQAAIRAEVEHVLSGA